MFRVFLILLFIAMPAVSVFSQGQSQSRPVKDSVSAYDEFTKAVNQSVNKNYTTETLFGMAFGFVLLVSLIVLYEIYRSNKTRQKLLNLAWEKFYEHADNLRLTQKDIKLLSNIVKIADLQDPYSIIKSPHIFELCVENFYERQRIEYISGALLAEIRDIRRLLGFLPLSRDVAYISTRQFDVGDRCAVMIPSNGPPSHKGMCAILSVKEKEWSIERPQGDSSIEPGTFARINFTRSGDAEYSFVASVIGDSDGVIFLGHSNKLNRTQLRNWVRVDVSIPVEVAKIDNDNRIGDMFSGKIIDMSGGGLGIAIPVKLLNGSMLKLNFELPELAPIEDLMVKVVRVAGPSPKDPTKFVHSVAFEGDVSKIQEQIVQYVFEVQRREAKIAKRN